MYAGENGNDWRRGYLRKCNFQYIANVEAANPDAAMTAAKQPVNEGAQEGTTKG